MKTKTPANVTDATRAMLRTVALFLRHPALLARGGFDAKLVDDLISAVAQVESAIEAGEWSSFDLSDRNAKMVQMIALIEGMIFLNLQLFRQGSGFSKIYESGVRYRCAPDEVIRDVRGVLARGTADADSLVAWRCAELRSEGVEVRPVIRWRDLPNGGRIYTVAVLFPDGTVEEVVDRVRANG